MPGLLASSWALSGSANIMGSVCCRSTVPSFNCMPPAFEWAQAHVHSLFLCFSAGGYVDEQGLQEAGGELRRAAAALLVGKEELNLDYCMLLSVVRRVDYKHEQSFATMNFLTTALKAVFWRKRERKATKHWRPGETCNARRNQRESGKGHREISPSFVELP